jgi:hypothetical protein
VQVVPALAVASGQAADGPAGRIRDQRAPPTLQHHQMMGDQIMAFVQIIEFRTADIDAGRRIDEEWRRGTEGKRTVRRQLLARDRSDPTRYFAMVFFDSYESAVANSRLPETQAAAEQYMKMSDGPPVFYDLDILEDQA